MASVDHIPPPMPTFVEPPRSNITAPPMTSRADSIMTTDMHIPGAWNGTNPGTPAPIGEDIKYFGQTLKTVPGTVQNYLPTKEQVTAGGSSFLNKAAAIVPAGVMNTATNALPKSMQPTTSPTAADAEPPTHPTDLSREHPVITTTNVIEHKDPMTPNAEVSPSGESLDKVPGIIPAGIVGTAAAYLPASLGGNTSTDSESHTKDTPVTTTGTEITSTEAISPDETKNADEAPAGTTWTEKVKSVLPVGAAAAYIPSALSTKFMTEDAQKPTPTSDEEGLNAPLPPVPVETPKQSGPIMGSSVSPDTDVQEALRKAANPQDYKTQIIPPMHTHTPTAPSPPPKEDQQSVESTQAIGGSTPVTLNSSEAEGDGYPVKNKSGVSGLAALVAGGGIGAIAVDHGLKDQREGEVRPLAGSNRLGDGITAPNEQPKDSFMHVVIPATPGAGTHEQGAVEKQMGRGALSSPEKLKKRDRSGSISAGEASPSSPSKGGMFSGIRKLTKKKDRSSSKGHERDTSHGDEAPPGPIHGDSLDTHDSNSSDPSPTSAGDGKKERKLLHKEPPTHYAATGTGEEVASPTTTNYHNQGSGSTAKRDKDGTAGMHPDPFSSNSAAPSSPSKVGFREKVKGEFMVVQGKLTRDEGLKEAGEKRKKGTV